VDVTGMVLKQIQKKLLEFPDFQHETNMLEDMTKERGHTCIFFPKFQIQKHFIFYYF